MDTNIAIAFLNRERGVTERLRALPPPLLPAPVVGELLYGAQRSRRMELNIRSVHDLVAVGKFVTCDLTVCEEYGRLKAALAKMGRPIPVNDLWIAACCLAAGATLVTRDAHFEGLPGLETEMW